MLNYKSQASIEYLIVIGFVTFVLIGILGVALYYSGTIKDRIQSLQINNCAGNIIDSAESVYYSGSPSKTTIQCYLPENVKSIDISENSLFVSYQTSSGISKTAFSSNVPLSGNITVFSGLRKISITAETDSALISLV